MKKSWDTGGAVPPKKRKTMTETAKDVQKIVLQTEEGPRSFLGHVIVDLSLNPADVVDPPEGVNWGRRYRWTDMVLYRVVDPQVAAQYVAYVVGRSMLYHRVDSPCRKGIPTTMGELAEDDRYDFLRPCREPGCYPSARWDFADNLDDGAPVAVEQERYTRHKCADATDLIEHLRGDDGSLSNLALKLLKEAAKSDDAIAAALTMERPL